MIIGHEMTHAFDNTGNEKKIYKPEHNGISNYYMYHSGRQYDSQGALRPWWTNETLKSFNEKTDCFVEQYSNFTVEHSINVN